MGQRLGAVGGSEQKSPRRTLRSSSSSSAVMPGMPETACLWALSRGAADELDASSSVAWYDLGAGLVEEAAASE